MSDPENPHAGQGSVLLDIGGDVGALVVAMPRAMVGREVEIRPLPGRVSAHPPQPHGHEHGHTHAHEHGHGHGHHPHVAVVERPVASGTMPSLVFPELQQGDYELHEKGTGVVALQATVRGGEVTTTTWPA